jgi:hypothetical protein
MLTPIKTIIRNKRSVAKAVNYIGKTPVWLPAEGEVTVDFEIWSVATDSQKTSIKTLCESGAIELSVMVLGPDGTYTVAAFDPTGGAQRITLSSAPTTAPKKATEPIKQMVDEKDHIVKVGGADTKKILEDMGAKAVGFDNEDIIPAREVKNGEPEPKKEEEAAPVEEQPEEASKKAAKKRQKANA